jgi:UDP-N-acetylglucosamine--N-acetylmuramyl-(pentapeptide) pyrophosphoryl-undecaprenol N-acetylglucosamine transferase
VIFATCGASPMPFERMMEALAALPAEQLYVQHGPAAPPPCARSFDFLPFGPMTELIDEANVFVCHAGVGSIMCALRAGHVPIVFPRYSRYSETVDDHQAELAEALARRGTLIVARTGEELADAVASVPPRGQFQPIAADSLIGAVRAAIMDDSPRRRWSRRRQAGAPSHDPITLSSGR